MATSRDIEEIISKISSNKAKDREEGIKVLYNWLEGGSSFGFCKILSHNTANLKPNEISQSKTWPFLVSNLIQCIASEISTSKKRQPKSLYAKTLRIAIQRAEDAKFPGRRLFLLPVVKTLFSHIWDVLRDVPTFQSEYGVILRYVLTVRDYRFHMRKRVYCSLVLLYMSKVERSLSGGSSIPNPKEEVFRCILTLHSLLENPPGDFTNNLREDIVKGFIQIFLHVRDEGKISRKLIECINTYLSKDGPNLGCQSMEIHSAVQEFLLRSWLTTHDKCLKEALILYARLQLKLVRTAADGVLLVEQLLDVVCKELDQSNTVSTSLLWSDATKDEKFGHLTSLQLCLIELAAFVFYWACVNITKQPSLEKRARREHAAAYLKEGLTKRKWLWSCAFCFLIRNYHHRIGKDLVIYWFNGICESFERILNDGNTDHAYDGVLWVLRSLQELSFVLLPHASVDALQSSSLTSLKLGTSWRTIWTCLMHVLPIFSNVASVADAALVLLGNMMSNELVNTVIVPQDVWDLRLFKHMPSMSALYFITCYFSRKVSQGDLRDVLHLRKNLLRAVLGLLKLKETSVCNDRVVMLLPAALFSLCTGCAPVAFFSKGLLMTSCYTDASDASDDWFKIEEHDREPPQEVPECSVNVLAEIELSLHAEVFESHYRQSVRLPRQITDPLLHEMEDYFLVDVMDKDIGKMLLPDIFFTTSLLSNCIYCFIFTRLGDENSSFLSKMFRNLLKLLEYAVSVIERSCFDLQHHGCLGSCSILDGTVSMVASLQTFLCCPLFHLGDQNAAKSVLSGHTIQAIEKLLRAFAKLYEVYSKCSSSAQMEMITGNLSSSSSKACLQNSNLSDGSEVKIVDMELDVNDDSSDMDPLAFGGKGVSVISSYSSMKWKWDMLLAISSFFSVLPTITWQIMFDLMDRENDMKVCDRILCSLCEHFSRSSSDLLDLVASVKNMLEMRLSRKLSCDSLLTALHVLLGTLISSGSGGEEKSVNPSACGRESEQSLISLGDLVNKMSTLDILDWHGRVQLIDCICNLIVLDPPIGQVMIERLLLMLRDPDYRVRLLLARRLGVLFQTWDGHEELFLDICSNFGVMLVMSFKGKLVTETEVLAAGPQPSPVLETVVVTLAHLAFFSEKIELEAIFMLCVLAAIDPCLRELVYAVVDSLSRHLQYTTRFKYLEELMGPILFCWVNCNVSLLALIEIRNLFVSKSEAVDFLQYCCPWLLSFLVSGGDTTNLSLLAKVSGKPLKDLATDHFVPIFAVCMALYCSKRKESEKGAGALQSSLLCVAELTEHERDKLIKRHMVSIVSYILSLASSSLEPTIPFFSQDTIMLAIQTVVDGFLEMDNRPADICIVDKINIFRPDRVFMFILQMHYRVTEAVHYRHKCHRLSAVHVLINVIGRRVVVPSTSCYLFNLIGQFISYEPLQEQCCVILSAILEVFRKNSSKDVMNVLGEQLQFLVSKLVACCIPSEDNGGHSTFPSQVVPLLGQLIVDSDPLLHEYIKELEPFPDLECFDWIRSFHQDLCKAYCPREHFLKFVRRASKLPEKLLLWSLDEIHKKLLKGEVMQQEKNAEHTVGQFNIWECEPEVVSAAWSLVRICSSNNASKIGELVSDFVSRVGIGDPHLVVLHLPEVISPTPFFRPVSQGSITKISSIADGGVSEELLVTLIRLLKKYLLDDTVKIIDIASQALQGILSTERGQAALLSCGEYERSLIEVHSKGVNMELVEKFLSILEIKSNDEAISLKDSSVWTTHGKTYDAWLCPLVYSLICYSNDMILRLCQGIVLLKSEVAELLMPNVLANLAGRKDLSIDLCKLISSQVRENVLIESNDLIKSVQVTLDALNELRLCNVMERASSTSVLLKRDYTKPGRSSGYSSRSRSSSEKVKDATPGAMAMSTLSWEKVYWLSIDYLVVAKSAVHCGSYFTAVMYAEHWCEEHFNSLTLGSPDFSPLELLPAHVEMLVSAVTQINEPDSLYGIIQSHKLTSQITTHEHEGNWSKALEYYDLQIRSFQGAQTDCISKNLSREQSASQQLSSPKSDGEDMQKKPYIGLMRSLQQIGCTHVLDLYCQGLTSQKCMPQHDPEFAELQYEAAWHAGNWDFSLLNTEAKLSPSRWCIKNNHFNENLHSCLRALQEGDFSEFHMKLRDSKQELVLSICHASKESTQYIYSSIVKIQILDHLGMAWNLRWKSSPYEMIKYHQEKHKIFSEPLTPSLAELEWLNTNWSCILRQTQLHTNLLEPFIAFRRVLLQVLGNNDCTVQHLLQSASILRKGSRFSLAAAALQEFKFLSAGTERQHATSYICCLGRLEEAKLLRAQGQHEMAINLARYILEHYNLDGEASNIYRLVGKWLAETRSSNSRTILDQYLKRAVELMECNDKNDKKLITRQCRTHFHLAHYTDALFRSYEERLNSNEWQAAMRLRRHKTKEFEALKRRLKSSTKGEKIDYSAKILELQKQLTIDKEEAERLQDDRDNFLSLALEGYKRCLVIGDKYDVRVVFRLISLWFNLSSRSNVVNGMLSTVKEVQSYKFVPLVYQIASRMGGSKDGQEPNTFQFALLSLVKKMAIDHPYHTLFQLLALANGDRVKDKQRSRNSFVVDLDKKHAAENLLEELSSCHGAILRQMKQMVEVYIKLAELETKKEDTSRRIPLPREIRSFRQLELVPVITATFPVDRNCQYPEGSFPHFKGLGDSVMIMIGINAPKVVECTGSDGHKYRQLAKSGNDDLRQDAVMEQFFGLVNTFLQNHRDTRQRRLRIRTYKVVPFTPSAGVLEWVDGTIPLGEYLIGSSRSGGAHGRYGIGDWSFMECREKMTNDKDKRMAFQRVCEKFRPVMHYFFLERFFRPADWFEKRLSYSRSVAASSMVGYIVGLGDRHSMNILIDQATAEVVHIDLGVAFEQGLMLKTPERVPFRLTRDIIDGMGVTGVEGVFRRCCEETLSVMRANKEALLTIIEVFIHDPLYKWALSPLKALQRQKETEDDIDSNLQESQDVYEGNKDAARALMRVKQKLDGYEEGEMRSVHGQVQQLIQDAIDQERLCQLFPGWGAWL